MTAGRIDDAQTSDPEADPCVDEYTLIVRAAVRDRGAHRPDELTIHGSRGVGEHDPADPAHRLSMATSRLLLRPTSAQPVSYGATDS